MTKYVKTKGQELFWEWGLRSEIRDYHEREREREKGCLPPRLTVSLVHFKERREGMYTANEGVDRRKEDGVDFFVHTLVFFASVFNPEVEKRKIKLEPVVFFKNRFRILSFASRIAL